MRTTTLGALGLVAALAVPSSAATGTPGPFAGAVKQGQTRTYVYDNNPSGQPCVDLAANYVVTLAYAPPGDKLVLTANGYVGYGRDGLATIRFQSGVCTAFPIAVTGTQVTAVAAFTVTVSQDALGPIT